MPLFEVVALVGALLVVPSSRGVDFPRICLVNGQEEEIDGFSRCNLSCELIRNDKILVFEIVGGVPIVIGHFVGNRFPALISREDILPLSFLPSVNFLDLGRGVDIHELGQASLEDLVREVEEDFAEHGEMAMVEGEVEIAVFAAGGVRVDQHIMQALRSVVFEWFWEVWRGLSAGREGRPLVES